MRIVSLAVNGLGNLKKVNIDFDALGPATIALAGPNGSGKTTLLSAMLPAALYRTIPFYNVLVQEHFSDEGGTINPTYEWNGKRYEIVIRGKYKDTPQCYLYENDTCLAGPAVRDFDNAIAEVFPPKASILASLFASQDDVFGFFTMDQKVRNQVFSHLLGLDEYDGYIAAMADIKKAMKLQLAEKVKSLEVFSQMKVPSIEELKLSISQYEVSIKEKEEKLNTKHGELSEVNNKILEASIKYNTDGIKAQQDRKRETQEAFNKVATKILDLESKKREIEATEYAVQFTNIENYIEQIESTLSGHRNSLLTTNGLIETAQGFLNQAYAKLEREWRTVDRAYQQFALESLRQKDTLAKVNSMQVHEVCIPCPLFRDASDMRKRVMELENEYYGLVRMYDLLCEELIGTLPTGGEIFILQKEVETVTKYIAQLEQSLIRHLSIKKTNDVLRQLTQDIHALESELFAYEKRLKEIGAIEEDFQKTQSEYAKASVNLTLCRDKIIREVADIEADIQRERHEHGKLVGQLDGAQNHNQVVDALNKDIAKISGMIGLDNLLDGAFKHCRRQSIQQMCPSIQDQCNEFLKNYQRGRFSVTLRTESKRAASDTMKEDFSPIIHDIFAQKDRKNVSGGEQAVLAEALRMAFSIVQSSRFGLAKGTLIRDEVVSHIDNDNLEIYMNILRSSIQNEYFHQIVFVSHLLHLVDQADVAIIMSNGKVEEIRA